MSSFLYRLGRACAQHYRKVFALWLGVLVLAGAATLLLGGQMRDKFEIPGSEGVAGMEALANQFPELAGMTADLLFEAPEGEQITDYAPQVEAVLAEAEAVEDVMFVMNPLDDLAPSISDSGRYALATVQIDASMGEIDPQVRVGIEAAAATAQEPLKVHPGGSIYDATSVHISPMEILGVIVALIALMVSFGAMIPAGLPILTAVVGVGLGMALVLITARFTDVISSTPTLALMIGLAVGIDYALFILHRHRAELATLTADGAPSQSHLPTSRSGQAGEHGPSEAHDEAQVEAQREHAPNEAQREHAPNEAQREHAPNEAQAKAQGDPQDEPRPAVATDADWLRGHVEEAAARANATAGSSVVFAGVTVIIALCGLFVAGLPFLTLMGVAAAATVAVAVVVALTLIPALAGALGKRLLPKGRARRLLMHTSLDTMGARWVKAVTKLPALTIAIVVAGLVALTIPAKDMQLALPDNGMADVGAPQRVTFDLIAEEFGPGASAPLVVTADIIRSTDPLGLMEAIGEDLGNLPGVERVVIATPNRTASLGVVVLQPETAQSDPATADLVQLLRSEAPRIAEQYDVSDVYVTGQNAIGIDVVEKTGAAMLPFGIVVVGLSLLLLGIVFRSVWVPIKAALGYVLSVGGALGATWAVFGYGWGAELFNVQKVGPVISFFPIILMGVLFGLAMDYEVFLVSRMREDFVHSGDAKKAVITGFAASARVVTTAAVIMVAVFAFFVPGADSLVKPIAFGLAVGVALDAFVVRMTLVPAVMVLLGRHAWWLPAWLERRTPHLDIEGESLVHHLDHRAWSLTQPAPVAIRADGLTIHDDDGSPLVEGATFTAAPGGYVTIENPDDVARRALLAAVAGRLAGDNRTFDGELFVLDYFLPDEAVAVRRRSQLLLGSPALPPEALAKVPKSVQLVVIDGELNVIQEQRLARLLERGVTVVVGKRGGTDPSVEAAGGTDALAEGARVGDAHAGARDKAGARPNGRGRYATDTPAPTSPARGGATPAPAPTTDVAQDPAREPMEVSR